MTFSIVAHCQRTGMFGVAVASSSPAVAARCTFANAGIGAVAYRRPPGGLDGWLPYRCSWCALGTIQTAKGWLR